jgi:predicted glycosyltransferase
MNIVIDIAHPAHVNFFKITAKRLLFEGHNITVICLDRGKLSKIVEKEFPGFHIEIIGKHKGSKYSVIFDANIKRFFQLAKCIRYLNADIGLGVGSFNFGGVLKLLNRPNIQFDDDPERGLNTILEKLTATKLFFPPIIESYGNISNFNALKEWAYLSPSYFTPDSSVLVKYGLKEKEYVFIREISTGSLNYMNQKSNILASISKEFDKNIKVLLSLENKKKLGYYPDNWVLIKEPVNDIHSILYYSKCVISSGDSMAREGSLLGVPSIYCGFRDMKANKILENKNILFHLKPNEVVPFVNNIVNDNSFFQNQESFRNLLLKEWVDVNDFIYKAVMNMIKNL